MSRPCMVLINKSSRKRQRGRLHQHWFDREKKYLESLGTTKVEDADNQRVWKELVEAVKIVNYKRQKKK